MTVITDNEFYKPGTPIQKFYAGQNVFLTGGTGFLGKILIEKLLRCCPDISSIYMLVRPKKGVDIETRVDKIFEDPVFERLKKEVPKYRHKIVSVAGDCSLPGLGMSVADRDLLVKEISIIFHVAATVKFDEKMKLAVAINISGTKEVLELSRRMMNLKSFIHVSTAYSNCRRMDIDEKFYDSPITGDNLIKLTEALDDEKLNAITETLVGDFPNTYAYTKQIAEQVVRQYGKDLPVGIFRPAIVISSYNEPVEGWIDNVYGPTGALVGAGAGLIRVLRSDDDCTAELVPVDLTVNALIASAWDVANNKNEEADPPIYNYIASWGSRITWGRWTELALAEGLKTPSARSVWCYSVTRTKSRFLCAILQFLLHTLPAIIVDAGLFLIGKKPRLLQAYRKIHRYSEVVAYFATTQWNFSNNNVRSMWDKLSSEDQKIFYFSMVNFDWETFMRRTVAGIRLYFFKDDPSNIPYAKKRMTRFLILHKLIKYSFLAMSLWLLWTLANATQTLVGKIGSICA